MAEVQTENPTGLCCWCCHRTKEDKNAMGASPITHQPRSLEDEEPTERTPLISGGKSFSGDESTLQRIKEPEPSISSLPEAIQAQGTDPPVHEEKQIKTLPPKPTRPDMSSTEQDPSIDLEPPTRDTEPKEVGRSSPDPVFAPEASPPKVAELKEGDPHVPVTVPISQSSPLDTPVDTPEASKAPAGVHSEHSAVPKTELTDKANVDSLEPSSSSQTDADAQVVKSASVTSVASSDSEPDKTKTAPYPDMTTSDTISETETRPASSSTTEETKVSTPEKVPDAIAKHEESGTINSTSASDDTKDLVPQREPGSKDGEKPEITSTGDDNQESASEKALVSKDGEDTGATSTTDETLTANPDKEPDSKGGGQPEIATVTEDTVQASPEMEAEPKDNEDSTTTAIHTSDPQSDLEGQHDTKPAEGKQIEHRDHNDSVD